MFPLGIKYNAFVEMKIGSWVKKTVPCGVNSKGQWTGPLTTPQLPTAQIEKEGVELKILSKGSLGSSDVLIGRAIVPMTSLLKSPSVWVDINGQLSLDNKFTGKYSISGMFLPPDSSVVLDVDNGDEDVPPIKAMEVPVEKASVKALAVEAPVAAAKPGEFLSLHFYSPFCSS